jgi:hypothetical protein
MELVKGYVLSALEGGATFSDSSRFCLRGAVDRVTTFKVLSPGLSQEL